MKLEILKDCRWCILFKGTDLKKGQVIDITDEGMARDMITAKHAKAYVEKKKEAPKDDEAEAKKEAAAKKKLEAEKKKLVKKAEKLEKDGKEEEAKKVREEIAKLG
jgi:hypothetical protein